jgi:predicted O-methyltransferase YrrM
VNPSSLQDKSSGWFRLGIHLRRRDILLAIVISLGLLAVSSVGWTLMGARVLPVSFSVGVGLIMLVLFEIYRRSEETRQAFEHIYKQTEGLISILSCLKLNRPLPPLRAWAVAPDLAQILLSTIFSERPNTIVECGSGTSTLLMSYCLKQNGQGFILSLDDGEQFADATRRNLRAHSVEEWAKVIHAPLREIQLNGKRWQWYDTAFLENVGSVDLLIVDGPRGSLGHMMRYPALPLLFSRLSPRAVVILDDSRRPDEKQIVDAWLKEFRDFECEWLDTQNGTAILRRVALDH